MYIIKHVILIQIHKMCIKDNKLIKHLNKNNNQEKVDLIDNLIKMMFKKFQLKFNLIDMQIIIYKISN